MISRFFIDRPIFASVLSIFLTLAGAICVFALPIAQYPDVVPPTVQVSVNYPGASAQVVADTVAAPIEQQVNGVENMLYMSSTSDNTGYYNLTVTFDLGTDLNTALVTVQNRVNLAVPQLPQAVQKQGLTIKKKSPNIMLVINLISPKGRYDDLYLSNYATIHVKDEIFRLEGVGDIAYLGQRDYSIRIWLDPEKLAALDMSATEVVKALQNQNIPLASGQLGQQPAPSGQTFTLPTDALGRLKTTEQFGDVIVRSDPGGPNGEASRFVRMRDVARIELGAQKYDQSAFFDNLQSVALAVYQLPGSNALDVADRVYSQDERAGKTLSPGPGISHCLRHHSLYQGIGGGRGQDAARRNHPGGHRRAGLPAKLAADHHSPGRRPRRHRRYLRGDGRARLFHQQHLPLRPGAGHRHRGR